MPQICVMGDQSSGKSSVLEALSGIPFPRGAGLVTRCPLRMVMRRAREGETWSAEVSTTVTPESVQKAKDVVHLSQLMNRAMHTLCADDVSFSTESVVINLVSPDACDLTVVDLPGIIRTVTVGQDVQAIEQVNRLIKSCLADERTVILAVIPANQDIATVDILERAEGVDPTGERTIGVLTKTDLIGQGGEDEIIEVVNNRRKPLALGYTMVKNRSQKDIKDNISSAKARENEENFFSTHPVFRNCNETLYGADQLSKKLTDVLVARIKTSLVPMKRIVEARLNEVRASLRAMPKAFSPPKTPQDRQKLLVAITQQYLRYLVDCIRGEYWDRVLVRHAELRMYNTIVKKFEIFQAQIMDSAPDFKDPEFIDDLATQIRQLRGRELPGFMSQQAFHMCIAQYIDLWQEPMQELIQDVHSVAVDVSVNLAEVLFVQYPGLREGFKNVTERSLAGMAEDTSSRLRNVLNREKDPFTMNIFLPQWVNKLRYDRFKKAVEGVFDECNASDYTVAKEETFISIREWYRDTHSVAPSASAADMSEIMEAYWNLSSKRFIDNCCMMTDSDLLTNLPARIQDAMYDFLGDDERLQTFFVEDPALAAKKLEAEMQRDKLMIAFSRLNSIVPPAKPIKLVKKDEEEKGEEENGVAEEKEKYESPTPTDDEVEFTVPIGEAGIGLIIVHDPSSSYVVIKGFRAMPYKKENPAQAAGLRVGDRIKSINDSFLLDHNHAVNLIRAAKGEIKLGIIRK
ncbi:Mx2, Mx-like dynamin-related GTPase [Ochromonadaceae sp. CCMP2298]|nr:Mx2, Mx-like dynamin-related GTPase [Ochromonadaceae sp. CCMP2298]